MSKALCEEFKDLSFARGKRVVFCDVVAAQNVEDDARKLGIDMGFAGGNGANDFPDFGDGCAFNQIARRVEVQRFEYGPEITLLC